MSVLIRLQQSMANLSKAEHRIGEVILSNPEAIVTITTAELAKRAEVSDPMVSRLCKTLGCQSFPAFKVQLAKSLASKESFITEAVSPGDSAGSYIEKRISANQAALEYIRSHLETEAIEQAVEALKQARQIDIFGVGGSAAVAQDAQHKLFRLGVPTIAYQDHLMQRMAAAAAGEQTVILMFSITGRTKSMIEVAKIAKKSGATLITITSPGSPLAKLADITITSGDELEDTTVYVPMTTRIVILTIIDIIATGLALAQGQEGGERLQKIKHSLDDTRF
ncbi:HTH-type transcriptional regulator HexR [Sinobacterium norvegicum]|uniref:HTH-type transcriptional regulator HexR n=1 Tax=Sinobacterium norvegicum TaxID=1641715 RepID=A0ABM9AD09_9GAMM|nr:transcriptional regulator HexR [Sinobacterium norvegicum]CAH0990903.1 HTH-type transcriptional regulator HexR [Sinobacterium norvegicum]